MKQHLRKPPWLKRKLAPAGKSPEVMSSLARGGLHTVCQEAHCPNRGECFGRGEATFLLLGPACTRRCTFCAVHKQKPSPPDPQEPERVARSAREMGLKFVVLTMVSRDDLPDGGAEHVAQTIGAINRVLPGVGVEALISDLGGSGQALDQVLAAGPQVLNHNLETVPRLYPALRPQAEYQRSLQVLKRSSDAGALTKSGLMLGLGETPEELSAVMSDLRRAGCALLTLGQYLAPSREHHPVKSYVPPERFAELEDQALGLGFKAVASGPYVRSSFQAGLLRQQALSA
jgi:lipoic acid synthetase